MRLERVQRDAPRRRRSAPLAIRRSAVQVRAAAERCADVFAERADVGALAAADVDRPAASAFASRRRRARWIVTPARRALDLDAGARVFVQRLAVALERAVHRRHLVDRARRTARRPAPAASRRRRRRALRDDFAFGVARGRRHAEAQRRLVALVGIEAAPARTWWRRRSTAAAGRVASGSSVPVWPAFSAR